MLLFVWLDNSNKQWVKEPRGRSSETVRVRCLSLKSRPLPVAMSTSSLLVSNRQWGSRGHSAILQPHPDRVLTLLFWNQQRVLLRAIGGVSGCRDRLLQVLKPHWMDLINSVNFDSFQSPLRVANSPKALEMCVHQGLSWHEAPHTFPRSSWPCGCCSSGTRIYVSTAEKLVMQESKDASERIVNLRTAALGCTRVKTAQLVYTGWILKVPITILCSHTHAHPSTCIFCGLTQPLTLNIPTNPLTLSLT